MKKQLLFLGLTLFSTSLSCYYDFQERTVCGRDIHISADLLYWKLRGDELNFLFTREGIDNQIDHCYEVNPQWNPGARVEISTFIECPRITNFARYTWYEAIDRPIINLINDSDLVAQSDFIGEISAFDTANIAANFYFFYSRFDTGISSFCTVCEGLLVEASAAFTYLYTRENLLLEASFPSEEESFHDKVSYSGYGVTLGCKIDYSLNSCFSFVGELGYTGLYGEFNVKQLYTELEKNSTKDFNTWRGRSIAQFMVGLKASSRKNCGYRLYNILGWEYLHLFDQTNWSVLVSQNPENGNKPTADIILQGLNWKFGVFF